MREQGALAQAASHARAAAVATAKAALRAWAAVLRSGRAHPAIPALAAGAALVALLGAAGFVGYVAAERDAPQKIASRYLRPTVESAARRLGLRDDVLPIVWERITTNSHVLEAARIPVMREGASLIFSLASVGDHIVFASRHGQLAYVDSSLRFMPLDLRTPMRLEELSASEIGRDPIFDYNDMRTVDLLAIETGPESYDLYASYFRFADDCFELAVSRTPLRATSEGVAPVTGAWEDVYAARPCLPVKHTGMRFAGHEGGGRLVRLDDDTLLLSVGVFQYDNVAAGQLAGQDPSTDLGKIIAISLSTGQARIYASGFRNPQGLTVAGDGRVWETEHGPQGGDEVNLITEGANYGWPIVTYGMDYGSPPRDWPYNESPGKHDGYTLPAFVFTPSIGISNIIEPDAREFPRWTDHLAAASLSVGNLYILRVQDDRIVYAEPIQFRTRLRDVISLQDGRIAMASDSGDLILVRNAQRARDPDPPAATGLMALAAASPDTRLASNGPNALGAQMFFYYCGSCHSLTGEMGVGPPLDGLMGRRVGSVEGYGYSETLRDFGGAWNRNLLRSFILEPERRFKGMRMPPSDIPAYELEPIVAYLATIKAAEAAP
jgi:cytochrome c2